MNDSAKEIDALDCKASPKNFERLFRYLTQAQARVLDLRLERLYELVPEAELRRAVRKAVDRHRPEVRSITCYASWWLRQAVARHAKISKPPFTLVQPPMTGGGRPSSL